MMCQTQETTIPTVTLNNAVQIPQLGFGVFQVPPEETQRIVEDALEIGYRHIDTAAAYRNEAGVGVAVAGSGIPREEIFITSKLRNGEQGKAHEAFHNSRHALGVDYVDLYLIHWPVHQSMRVWEKIIVPEIAAITIGLLSAAGATGIDEMASARIAHPASVAVAAAAKSTLLEGEVTVDQARSAGDPWTTREPDAASLG
jgi:diketogulonate reductase-like aldo/keto reductase